MSSVSDTSDSDSQLLVSLSRGDPEAVANLFLHYGPRMVGFAQRYVGARETAEDVVGDLLERWLHNPPSVRGQEHLRGFLATSVYHAAVDLIRRDRAAQGKPPRSADFAPLHDPLRRQPFVDSRPEFPPGGLLTRLPAALDQLSHSDRLLLETYYGQALSPEECMSMLRIGRAAFHQRLHRARMRLARLLLPADRDVTPRGRG